MYREISFKKLACVNMGTGMYEIGRAGQQAGKRQELALYLKS